MIKFTRLRRTGHVANMEEERSTFEILTGKPTGKRPSRKPRWRWEDYISINIKEMCIVRGIGLIRLRIGFIGEPL